MGRQEEGGRYTAEGSASSRAHAVSWSGLYGAPCLRRRSLVQTPPTSRMHRDEHMQLRGGGESRLRACVRAQARRRSRCMS